MRNILLLLYLITGFIHTASSQPPSKTSSANTPTAPKLIVGIVVDQMRYDYIYRYWNKFGEGGFKKLVNEGFFCRNAAYNYVPTYTGPGHASIYTGTIPAVHGIISNDWFRRDKEDTMYCVSDPEVTSIGTASSAGKMSPKNLLTTTVTDELRYNKGYKNKVIGIALKDRGAILPAGHSANAAYWYDASNGHWVSSSYYMKTLPSWVNDFNQAKISDKYLSQPWNTLLPIEQYTESTADHVPYEEPYFSETAPVFPHDFPKIKQGNYELIRRSPWGNSITGDFALAAVKGENLGNNGSTDFLAISFSSTDYVGHQFGCDAIETQDTYLRLDRDLAALFSHLEKTLGKHNVLVFLTADHAALPNQKYLREHKVPAGIFNIDRAVDSLKNYLNAVYGAGNWITCVNDDQVYFNHTLLAERKIDLSEISAKASGFLIQMNGIARVIPAAVLNESEFRNPPMSLLQNGFNPKLSGDLIILLSPGLVEYKETGTTHGSAYSYDTHVPLLFYGWKVPHGNSAEPVQISDIAPTLSNWLNIEFPNGCTGNVIPFIIK